MSLMYLYLLVAYLCKIQAPRYEWWRRWWRTKRCRDEVNTNNGSRLVDDDVHEITDKSSSSSRPPAFPQRCQRHPGRHRRRQVANCAYSSFVRPGTDLMKLVSLLILILISLLILFLFFFLFFLGRPLQKSLRLPLRHFKCDRDEILQECFE